VGSNINLDCPIDLTEAICRNEPTYTGEADIRREIIEPQGIDLPTTIYDNAEQAINLSVYSEEIRPFIKDIFIDKFPQVVALHAIDAGDWERG